MELTVRLFGSPEVCLNGEKVTFLYKKVDALLYYLIVRKTAPRAELSEMLWPDASWEVAGKNLRHALYILKKTLSVEINASHSKSVIELNPHMPLQCDYLRFVAQQDVSAYTGTFLDGFSVKQSAAFEEWLQTQRDRLRTSYLKRLSKMSADALRSGDAEAAEACAVNALREDPLDEESVVQLMNLYAKSRSYHKAVRAYQELQKNLSDELGIAPLKETTARLYEIVNEWNLSAADEEGLSKRYLVGRTRLYRMMDANYGQFLADQPCRSLLLQGETGVGKRHLLQYFLDHRKESSCSVWRAACYPAEKDSPLSLWRALLTALPEALLADGSVFSPAARAFLSRVFSPVQNAGNPPADSEMEGPLRYRTLCNDILLVLSEASRSQKLLAAIENIQFIDEMSLDVLSGALETLDPGRFSLLLTADETLPGSVAAFVQKGLAAKKLSLLSLGCFSLDETAVFMEKYSGVSYSDQLIGSVYALSGGNALLLVQLLNVLEETGDPDSLPADSEQILSFRLSSLSTDSKQLMDLISLFPRPAPLSILQAVTRRDPMELMYLCSELKLRALITEQEVDQERYIGFANERIGEILSASLPALSKRVLHLRIAEAFAAQNARQDRHLYARLAYHYGEGGDRLNAFAYKVRDLEEHTGLCYELLPVFSKGGESGAFPDANWNGYFDSIDETFKKLSASGADRQVLSRLEPVILQAEGRFFIANGGYDRGVAAIERLIALSKAANDTAMELRALRQMIFYGIQIYDPDRMKKQLDIGLTLAEETGDQAEYAMYVRLKGLYLLMTGRFDEAQHSFLESIRRFSVLDTEEQRYILHIAGAHNYLGECLRAQGRYRESYEEYEKAIVLNRPFLDFRGTPIFYANYAQAAYAAGEAEKARELFEQARAGFLDSREIFGRGTVCAYTAVYEAAAGKAAEAGEQLSKAHALAKQMGSPREACLCAWADYRLRQLMDDGSCPRGSLEKVLPQAASAYRDALKGLLAGVPNIPEAPMLLSLI